MRSGLRRFLALFLLLTGLSACALAAEEERPLFPSLHTGSVSFLRIQDDERSFIFRRVAGSVCVNDCAADAEAFDLLLDSICLLPVRTISKKPDGAPLLSLEITADKDNYSASFYPGSGQHEALISYCEPDGNGYARTDSWRVFVLMLACEGTRIFDEAGRETPMK